MRNNTDNRYILERYKAGGSNRYVCPQCGKRRCFTRYVDLETGEYIADNCGKCNHTASCGYHYPPREYFRDHPELKSRAEPERINGKPVLAMTGRGQPTAKTHGVLQQPMTEHHQTEFFDISWAEKASQRTSTFRQWLERLAREDGKEKPFEEENLRQVLADYYVGGTTDDIIVRGVNHGPAVVFWQIDEQGRVHDAKLMAYRKDGHRVGDWMNSMRSICERKHRGPQLAETEKVLFGLHLLPRHPDKAVCIVESEKTALICASRYPQFLWLATGGCGNLQKEKLKPLQGRKVVVYPDSGEYDKWKARMEESGLESYRVMDFMEQYVPNTDIADLLLGEATLKQEPVLESTQKPEPLLEPRQMLDSKQDLPFPLPQEDCPF